MVYDPGDDSRKLPIKKKEKGCCWDTPSSFRTSVGVEVRSRMYINKDNQDESIT